MKVKCKVDTCFAAGRANSVEWPWHYRHCQDRQRQDGGVSVANDHTHHGSATAPAWWRTDRSHLCSNQGTLTTGSFVRSFVLSSGVARPLAVYATCFQPPPALRPRLAQCATPLTLGLVLYILRAQLSLRVSLTRCQWCSPVLQVEPLASPICYPRRRLSPHPDAHISDVMLHKREMKYRRLKATVFHVLITLIAQIQCDGQLVMKVVACRSVGISWCLEIHFSSSSWLHL